MIGYDRFYGSTIVKILVYDIIKLQYMQRQFNISKNYVDMHMSKYLPKVDMYHRRSVTKRNAILTLSPPNKLSSAIFLVCFNFQNVSMFLKVGENIV